MSGRDLREFLQRKSSFTSKPLSSKTGLCTDFSQSNLKHSSFLSSIGDVVNRYASRSESSQKPAFGKVDYGKMADALEQYKTSGMERYGKVKSLAKKGSDSKTAALLKQHREAWLKEKRKLEEERKREEYDLEYIYGSALADSFGGEEEKGLGDFWRAVTQSEGQYAAERDVFRSEHILGLLECRNKLKAYLRSHDSHVTSTSHLNRTEVKRELERTAEQTAMVSTSLQEQESALERELEQLDTGVMNSKGSGWSEDGESSRIQSLQVLPTDVSTTEGLSEEARQFIVHELNQLSDHYLSALDRLRESHRAALDGLSFAGWSREEHKRFCLVLEQYPPNMTNRRSLYLDRLKREFPQR